MKIPNKPIEVTTNAAFVKSEDMTVDAKNLKHVLRLLTDIYSDRESSVVRETVSNAIDSHRAAGQTRPVEVTFPNYLNASFIVKDYGVGMSATELSEIYRKYGTSTKENSNDQLGAFGLGAKAPLALTSSFTVNAVKDGKRNIVVISKAEDGRTQMNYLPEQDTDEPNGVTVTVPVAKPREFERVLRSPIFLGHKPGTILVNGKEPSSIHSSGDYKTLGAHGWYEYSDKIVERGYNPDLRVMLDAIPYGIPNETATELLADFQDTAPLRTILQRLVLALPNGSVEVTNNRENLIYSDFTKNAIKRVLAEAVPLMLATAAQLIATAPDRRAAIKAADSLHAQQLLASGPLVWQGEQFGTNENRKHYSSIYRHTYAAAEGARESKDPERLYFARAHATRTGAQRVTRDHAVTTANQFQNTHRFILITEATRKDNGDFNSDSRLTVWFQHCGVKRDTYHDSVAIYTTTRKLSELPPFMVALAEATFTAEQVIATAKANAIPRPKRNADTGFTVTHTRAARNDKKDMLVTVEPAKLNPDLKYVIAQATGTAAEGPMTYENSLYAFFRAVNSGKVIAGTENLLKAATAKGYAFVILPATADRQRYIDALPNVHSIDTALAATFAFDATEVEQDYFAQAANQTSRYRFGPDLDTRGLYKADNGNLIEQVKDADTREFLSLHRTHHSDRARALVETARFWSQQRGSAASLKETGPLTRATIEKIEAAATRASRVYPLLADGIPAGAERDAVDYINMIDARRVAAN